MRQLLGFQNHPSADVTQLREAKAKSWFKNRHPRGKHWSTVEPLPLPEFLFVYVVGKWAEEMKKLTARSQHSGLFLHNWHSFIALLFLNHIWSPFHKSISLLILFPLILLWEMKQHRGGEHGLWNQETRNTPWRPPSLIGRDVVCSDVPHLATCPPLSTTSFNSHDLLPSKAL